MTNNQPDLASLAAFVAVARHRSFRGAAKTLQSSASTLSERLSALEDRLGVRLLSRTTRSVAPTDAGAALLARLGPALDQVAEALEGLEPFREMSGRLRLNAPPPAAEGVLAPILAAFLAAHPRIHVELVTDSAFVDIVAQGFDAGVRWGEHLAPGMIAVRLPVPPQRYVVVASPALLARVGRPLHPRDLLTRPCVRFRFASGSVLPWEFERGGETLTLTPDGPLTATHGGALFAAARAGVGFALTFEDLARDLVGQGALETVLDEWCPPFPGPYLYYAGRHHLPPPLRALVAFLTRYASLGATGGPAAAAQTSADGSPR